MINFPNESTFFDNFSFPNESVFPLVVNYPVPVTFHPDTLSWRDRAMTDGGLVTDNDLIILNSFVEGVYELGLRDSENVNNHIILELLPLMGHNLASCLTKLWYHFSAPNIVNINFVEQDYIKTQGLKGRSSAQTYLKTGFIPFNILTNSGSLGLYNLTDGGLDACEIGGDTGTNNPNSRFILHTQYLDNNIYFDAFSAEIGRTNTLVPVTSSLGFIMGNRVSETNSKIYKNGIEIAVKNNVKGIAPGTEVSYYCLDYAVTGGQFFSDRTVGLFFIGNGIPEIKIDDFNNLVQNLMIALGRVV